MRTRRFWVRWTNLALVVLLAGMLLTRWDEIGRKYRYWLYGAGLVDGMTLYLDPMDWYLTHTIVDVGEWEPGESAEFRSRLRPGDTVIDVGANIGWYTLLSSAHVGPTGRVIAFEPAPPSLALLRKSVAANRLSNIVIEPAALSDQRGSLTLHLDPWNRGHHSLVQDTGHDGEVTVETLALDEYLRGHEADIGLIKIDVEGAEGLVLAGMQETLRKQLPRAIIVEYTPAAIKKTGKDPIEVLHSVIAAGYRVSELNAGKGGLTALDERSLHVLTERLEAEKEHTDLLFERVNRS